MQALPADPDAAKEVVAMRDFDGHPGAYLREHYDALCRFYREAAAVRRATATWWD